MINPRDLMMQEPPLTLAVAESMTCGNLQAMIGRISGASGFFLGGLTAYAPVQKMRRLGVSPSAANRDQGVSARAADEMARGVCRLFHSDLGLATTGHAERSPEAGVNNPFAWWALVHRRRGRFIAVRCGRIECPGASRVDAQLMVAEAVMAELVAYLVEFRDL